VLDGSSLLLCSLLGSVVQKAGLANAFDDAAEGRLTCEAPRWGSLSSG
jgi:hypothetical protein